LRVRKGKKREFLYVHSLEELLGDKVQKKEDAKRGSGRIRGNGLTPPNHDELQSLSFRQLILGGIKKTWAGNLATGKNSAGVGRARQGYAEGAKGCEGFSY